MPRLHRTAMTVGFVILSAQPVHGRLLAHEQWHIRQFCAWGPLFIPVYFLLAIPYGYRRHPMEIRAQVAAGERAPTRPDLTPLVRTSTSRSDARRACADPGDEAHPPSDPTTDPGDDVTGVVHARVHAGVADGRGRHAEGQAEGRHHLGDRRRRRPPPTRNDPTGTTPRSASRRAAPGHARRVGVGTAAMPGELHRQVHDRRRAGDRGHAGERRTPAPTASDGEEHGRGADPQLRMVGRARERAEGTVERRCRRGRDRPVHRLVDGRELAQQPRDQAIGSAR